MDSFS